MPLVVLQTVMSRLEAQSVEEEDCSLVDIKVVVQYAAFNQSSVAYFHPIPYVLNCSYPLFGSDESVKTPFVSRVVYLPRPSGRC